MSEHEWVGTPTTESAWTALSSPSDTGLVRLAFRGTTDRLALASQLERWRAALARVPADVLVLPDIIYDAGGAYVTFPTPAAVGPNLPDQHKLIDTIRQLGFVAEALDSLHEAGVVHGALSAHSLWWSSSGKLRFPDAGLANALEGVVTPPAAASPYRAPEFWHGQARTRFSDQYALAVMAYEWITGHKREVDQSLEGVTSIEPLMLEPSALRAVGAPIALADVLQRALSFTPTARYETCKAFVDELKKHTDALWSPEMPDRRKKGRKKLSLPRWTTVARVAAVLVVLVLMGANVDAMRRAATFDWLKSHLTMTRVEVRPRQASAQQRTPEQMLRGSLPGAGNSGSAPSGQVASTMSRDSMRSAMQRGTQARPETPSILVDVKDPALDAARLLDRATSSASAAVARSGTQGVSNGRIADNRSATPSASSPAGKAPTLIIGPANADAASANTSAGANASGTARRVDPKAPAILVLTVPKESRVYVDGILTRNTTHVAVAPGSHDITVLVGEKTVQKRVSLAAGDTVTVKFVP